MRGIVLACLFALPLPAAADLYRWVDPATGSVKFSSYPPPWYGDEALQRRGPKVERIPAGREAPPAREEPETPPDPAKSRASSPAARDKAPPEAPRTAPAAEGVEAIDKLWREMLAGFSALRTADDVERVQSTLRPQLDAFAKLSAELDRVDPAGAERRAGDSKAIVARLTEALRALPPRTGGLLRSDR